MRSPVRRSPSRSRRSRQSRGPRGMTRRARRGGRGRTVTAPAGWPWHARFDTAIACGECPLVAVKNYVLDTNVLLHDARAFYAFADNNVIIPIYVIEEIDTFKKDQSELGRNARQVARLLDQYRHDGGLSHAQKMENGGTVRVALSKNPIKNPSYDSRSMDQRILEIALEVRDAD